MSNLIDVLRQEYATTDDVAAGLAAVEDCCLPEGDMRGVFATAYLHITKEIVRSIVDNEFADAEWTRRYLIAFGNLYRNALLNYETGETTGMAKAWRIAFDAAHDRQGLVIQHLTLGINAHINHDLPLALVEAGLDPDRLGKHADHTAVNLVLAASTDGLKRTVADMYAPILNRLDRIFGRLDDEITNFSIPKARQHAWDCAVLLAAADTAEARNRVRRMIDEQAAVLARLILSSPTRHPILLRLVDVARRIDGFLSRIGMRGRRLESQRETHLKIPVERNEFRH